MKRDYITGNFNDIVFFTGVEVEKTPAFGLKTLFVVGTQPLSEIIKQYKENKCDHVYLGANQSYDKPSQEWNNLIIELLENNILTTLDVDISHLGSISNQNYLKHEKFILQISVKIPDINNLNKNTMIKIDDIDFEYSNDGVWCHSLDKLKTEDKFTKWDEYRKDSPLS